MDPLIEATDPSSYALVSKEAKPPLSVKTVEKMLSDLPVLGPGSTGQLRDAIRALHEQVKAELGGLDPGQALLIRRDSGGVKVVANPPGKPRSYVSIGRVALRSMGGKLRYQQMFAYLMPPGPVPVFVDAMVGGGSITLAALKGRVAKSYWINDLNPAVVAFYRVCADEERNCLLRDRLHRLRVKLLAMGGDQNALLDYYMALLRELPSDDLAAAERYFVLNQLSFNGIIGYPKRALKPFTRGAVNALGRLTALRNARITNVDVMQLLDEVPVGAFVFVDPPYLTNPGRYSDGHQHFDVNFDHEKLIAALSELRHRSIMFMLTYDKPVVHDPVLRPMLAQFRQELCAINYQNGRGKSKKGKPGSPGVEVAIMNYYSAAADEQEDLVRRWAAAARAAHSAQ